MIEIIFQAYLKLYILGCMTFYIPGSQFYGPQEMFFQYGAMGLLGIGYFVPRKREAGNLFLGLILLYAILNTVLFHFEPHNRMILLNLFLGFLVIREVSERIDFNIRNIGKMLFLFCLFNVLWLALQINNIDPVFSSVSPEHKPEVDAVGWMGLKSNLGSLAALSFPFIFHTNPFASLIVLPLLWFGKSSAAIASVFFTLLFMLWHKNKRLFFASLVLAGVAGAFYVLKVDMPSGEFEKRFPVWFAGIKIWSSSNPVFGLGLGQWGKTGFTTIQNNGEPQTWIWAHNEFIQYGFEMGFAGVLFLVAYFKNLFSKLKMKYENHVRAVSFLIPLVLTSAIHFPFHIARFAGLGCLMIALIEAYLSDKEYA